MAQKKKTVAAWLVEFGAWIAPFLPVVIGGGAKVRDLCNARPDIATAFDLLPAANEWTEQDTDDALESLVPELTPAE